MKRPVHFAPGVKDALRLAVLVLRASIVDVLLDLATTRYRRAPSLTPTLVTPAFRAIYSYGPDLEYVSVWVPHIDT
ncbi:hypothetical protein ACWDLG_23210 [Nonomuraea sp. NPDC003727]